MNVLLLKQHVETEQFAPRLLSKAFVVEIFWLVFRGRHGIHCIMLYSIIGFLGLGLFILTGNVARNEPYIASQPLGKAILWAFMLAGLGLAYWGWFAH